MLAPTNGLHLPHLHKERPHIIVPCHKVHKADLLDGRAETVCNRWMEPLHLLSVAWGRDTRTVLAALSREWISELGNMRFKLGAHEARAHPEEQR